MPGDYRISWSLRAQRDLSEIWFYLYERASRDVADAQIRKVHVAVSSLRHSPFRGRPRDELRSGLRSVLARPYLVFYSVIGESVEIARVLHGSRNIPALFVGEP